MGDRENRRKPAVAQDIVTQLRKTGHRPSTRTFTTWLATLSSNPQVKPRFSRWRCHRRGASHRSTTPLTSQHRKLSPDRGARMFLASRYTQLSRVCALGLLRRGQGLGGAASDVQKTHRSGCDSDGGLD
jgi:hypothetical protein